MTTNLGFSQNGMLSKIGSQSEDDTDVVIEAREVRPSEFRVSYLA